MTTAVGSRKIGHMLLSWMVDTGVAVVLVLLEVAALVAFWFWEGLRQWAARDRVKGAELRLWLVLALGPVGLASISYGAVRVGWVITGLAQALMCAALTGMLMVGLGTEFSRWRVRSAARRDSKRIYGK
ncbi:DUF6234 family protein [Streptomyces sp. NPDC051582]|uniref:DUF6234 family protein n=1 Tax=Streptomyces sp. NPDC051582 TaxID=3155167 RepID=UPI0034417A93